MNSIPLEHPNRPTPASGFDPGKVPMIHFDPETCLLGAIQLAMAMQQSVVLAAHDRELLRIDPASRRYALMRSPLQTTDWLTPARQIRMLRAAPLTGSVSPGAIGDVVDLLWDAGYHGSRGQLPQGAHPYDVIELRQWPNLTRVAHCYDSMRICALLTRSRATVAMVSRWLKVPIDEVYRVYAAGVASGLIELRFSGAKLSQSGSAESARAPTHDDEVDRVGASEAPASMGLASFLGRMVARLRFR